MIDLKQFMDKTHMPRDVADKLLNLRARIDACPDGAMLDGLSREYYARVPSGMEPLWERLGEIAARAGVPVYYVQLLMYAGCADALYSDYITRGLSDELFWDTVEALREEFIECVDCKKPVGGFSIGWTGGFLDMTRFKLGRFQYELWPFRLSSFSRGAYTLYRGEWAINIHIPSMGGAINKAARMDSYRQAYEFFRGRFPGGEKNGAALPFMCDSWLLLPAHERFLPRGSNIIDFMHDFTIVDWSEDQTFTNGWRIFYDRDGLPLGELPRDTSLQRAYIDWMAAGNKTGSGLGVFFFDGESIL